MITRIKTESLTREYSDKDKFETLWEMYKPSIEKSIINQAKRGKRHTYINQDKVNYLSNVEFKKFIAQQLRGFGYDISEENSNSLRINWE